MTEFNIGRSTATPLEVRPTMEVGGRREVEELFAREISLFKGQLGGEYISLPYTFLHSQNGRVFGDFANGLSGCAFEDIRFNLSAEPFHPEPEIYDLFRLCHLLQPDKVFTSLENCMFVRSLRVVGGELELTLGPGLYTEAAFSVNSDGLVIDLDAKQKKFLADKLEPDKLSLVKKLVGGFRRKYGRNRSVRHIVREKYGRMPAFDEGYSYIIGSAALLKTSDGQLIFTKRSPGTTLFNHGINVPTSGGATFNEGALRQFGLPRYLQAELLREVAEELNIWGENIRQIIPLGLVRELSRGCTSDALHLIVCRLTTAEVVKAISENTHPSRVEIDGLVYAMSLADACRLVRHPHAEEVLHHKALVALVLAHRAGYLS